jgi:hypothetical protein
MMLTQGGRPRAAPQLGRRAVSLSATIIPSRPDPRSGSVAQFYRIVAVAALTEG